MRGGLVVALCLVVACRGKQEPAPKAGSAGSGSAVVIEAPRDAGKKALTPEQRAELAKRIKAGVDLRKQQKWGDALAMFQSALEISPGDPRVLSEMGWCAIQEGNVEQAKQCLASIEEKPPEPVGPSIEPPPHPVPTPFCAPGKEPCECIVAHAFAEATDADQTECAEDKEPSPVAGLPGFKVYRARSTAGYGASWRYLLDETGQLAAVIAGETEHGKRSEELVLDKAELKTIGGHQVLWLQTTGTASATYAVGQEGMQLEDVSATYVTICLPGAAAAGSAAGSAAAAPTTCPLRDVPIHRTSRIDRYETVEGKAKTERAETKLDLALAPSGTATVKFVSGEHDAQIDALLGAHKLW